MPRSHVHPLIEKARRALPRSRAQDVERYLELLDRRLAALAALAAGESVDTRQLAVSAAARSLARRVLAPLEGRWDDGDESLVRDHLDRWLPDQAGADPRRAAAQALTAAAKALVEVEARPPTIWFYLWAMESLLGTPPDRPERHGPRRRRPRRPAC